MQTKRIGDHEVLVIDSSIELTSNYTMKRWTYSVDQIGFADGSRVDYVVSDNVLASFIEPDVEGKFYFLIRPGMRSVFVAFEDLNGKIHEFEENAYLEPYREIKSEAIVKLIFGIPMSLFVVGIPVVIKGLMTLKQANAMAKVVEAGGEIVRNLKASAAGTSDVRKAA